jgi:hypothetical protein
MSLLNKVRQYAIIILDQDALSGKGLNLLLCPHKSAQYKKTPPRRCFLY